MPRHEERKLLPYTPDQLYGLVMDIERYPEFIPWCTGLRIRRRTADAVISDVRIGFKGISERFTCRVRPHPELRRIDVSYEDGPFKYLRNTWIFEDHPDGCVVDFFVDFEFKSLILNKIMGLVFTEAVKKMVGAFEARAGVLYGSGGDVAAST